MSRASLPHSYWDEIFSSVVFLINRLPSSHTSLISYTVLHKQPPDYSSLQVLGCLCFPHTRPYNTHKLQLRSMPCVFIGYCSFQKGYRCLDISTNRIFVSRSVQFDEQVFPFAHSDSTTAHGPSTSSPLPLDIYKAYFQPDGGPSDTGPTATLDNPIFLGPVTDSPTPSDCHLSAAPDRSLSSDRDARFSPDAPPPPTSHQTSTHPMVTRTHDNTRRPHLFPDHIAYLTSLHTEPTSFNQTKSHPEWRRAMASELDALAHNKTWTLVPPPPNQQVIGCKWVFKIKCHSDGSIERYKARLVAKGYHQQEGIDYFDTFSPVIRPTTIRVVLSLATSYHWPIKQLDVNNAFLHGDLTEWVYMAQPPGFSDSTRPDHVCLLSKAIYGLKQSPRAWFQKLSSALLIFGFTASQYDPSLFISSLNGHITLVLVYVDDILITGSDSVTINSCITHLNTQFALKDLGQLHYFLRIAVSYTSEGFHLSQTKYILDLLIRTNLLNAKAAPTPISTGVILSKADSEPYDDPHNYRSVLGALQYATLTRPDISFVVNKLSQYMHSPTTAHWTAVKRILRYLLGTLHHGLTFHYGSSVDVHAYSDADWAGCPDDRRSTSGYCLFMGRNLVSWSTKKQPTVSCSAQRPNTAVLLPRVLKYFGFNIFFRKCTLPYPLLRFCGVITLVRLSWPQIQCFIPVPSM